VLSSAIYVYKKGDLGVLGGNVKVEGEVRMFEYANDRASRRHAQILTNRKGKSGTESERNSSIDKYCEFNFPQ
tara:strand:+ start:273 stop:491 length:219 start_codon:yes stop_codon:yes gene_type:complete